MVLVAFGHFGLFLPTTLRLDILNLEVVYACTVSRDLHTNLYLPFLSTTEVMCMAYVKHEVGAIRVAI